MRVLVLGGAGFIGRHAVSALLERGHAVIVGSRRPGRVSRRLGMHAGACVLRRVRFEELACADWLPLIEDCDAVVNCVGILRERGRETYDAVHVRALDSLAGACATRGLRLVHVSALGLQHPHRSRFLRSKREGERRLAASGADYCLVRPSLLDGDGGFGASWIRALARLPLHVLARDATGKIAALDARDLGEALANLCSLPLPRDAAAVQREFELGGLQAPDIAAYLQGLRQQHARTPAIEIRIPSLVARIASHAFDLLHFSPLSFGHWELLHKDNVPSPNRLAELLGRPPRDVAALSARSPAPAHCVGPDSRTEPTS